MRASLMTCSFTIDSLRNNRPRGKSNRVWWRRSCKRNALPGERYCWQHDRIMNPLKYMEPSPDER